MKQTLRILAAALALTLGAAGTIALTPAEASAATGGLDLNRHCARHHSVGFLKGKAVLVSNNHKGWRCKPGSGPFLHPIDMHWACREQYGSRARANARQASNPYSWYCTF